jgi:DNA processing protein
MPAGSRAAALLSADQKRAWLRLMRTDGVGPITFRQLINRFGSAAAAMEALPDLSRRARRGVVLADWRRIDAELDALERMGGRIVASGEAGYPPHLRHIADAPPLISVLGDSGLDLERTVGMVGARNASSAGRKMTEILARELGAAGYTVVSGLARGIDAAAHAASLSTGTLAVLAGGLDSIYPAENVGLAESILDHAGLLVSEMPLGWQPRSQDFPRRNRIVSGIALGVVVVAAAKRSGSLITARMALEQDREVFAVPGSPLDPRAEGGNALIQQGAHLVTSSADILAILPNADPARDQLFETAWTPDAMAAPVEPAETDRARLREALSTTPMAIDDLVAATGITPSAMQGLLLELDLDGVIEWSGGQRVALRY